MAKERTIIDVELIWRKLNNSLSEEEDVLLNQWIEESPFNRSYYEKARIFYLQGSISEKVDADKAWKSFKKRSEQKILKLRMIIAGSVAAAILVLVGISSFFRNEDHQVTQQTQLIKFGSNQATLILDDGTVLDLSLSKNLNLSEGGALIKVDGKEVKYSEKGSIFKKVKYNTLKVPRGGEYFLQLSDGTRVWLNSETVIHYPVQFSGRERRIELIGEAYFEVTKNEKVPFIIESDNQVIKVLGTEFNLSSYTEAPFIYTTLVNGRVEVSSKDNPSVVQVLAPNEQSCFHKTEKQITKKEVDPYKFVAWKYGRFVFEDQNLDEIMNTLSKWYDVDVVFVKNDLKHLRFTGNLPRYADFNEIVTKIQKTNEAKFSINNKRIIIGE